jgi:hypothetical protein
MFISKEYREKLNKSIGEISAKTLSNLEIGKNTIIVSDKKYNINIDYDECLESPREWDNLGTIAYHHSKYILGDEEIEDEDAFYYELAMRISEDMPTKLYNSIIHHYDYEDDLPVYNFETTRDKMNEFVDHHYVIIPVYMYDHSGVTINTTGFACPWDSGQVGFIYCSIEDGKREFHYKVNCPGLRKRIKRALEAEIEIFDEYIKGNVYSVEIYENDALFDNCGGFIGDNSVVDFVSSEIML